MKNKQIKIYSDHIQKRIEDLDNQINRNCLSLYQEYKPLLDEALMEGVVEHEVLMLEYNSKVDEINSPLYSQLERIYQEYIPIKTIDLVDIYFAHGVH